MKKVFLVLLLLCGITVSAVGQGKFLKALKKGLEKVEEVGKSDAGTAAKAIITTIAESGKAGSDSLPVKQDTVYVPVDVNAAAKMQRTKTETVTTPGKVVYRPTPRKEGTEIVEISKTLPVYRLETGERYVKVDCSQYVNRTREIRSTLLDKLTIVDERFVYAHNIDVEVVKANYPYTSFFYLNDPKGEIINLSEAVLDNEQREYSMWFTSTYAKKFPFYDAIRPISEMLGVGTGMATAAGKREILTEKNAPTEIKTLAADFFNNTQNGYVIAVEGKMETAERDRKARGLLQQNYLRFFDDGLQAEFAGEDMTWETVRFNDNYVIDFGDRQMPLTQASDESKALFNYIKANPEKEMTYSFAGDNTARRYTFEYRFYTDELAVFAMFYTPLTMRFDVRTFYDKKSDATYFIYFYSLGYDKKGVESANRLSWEQLRESIGKACGFNIDDYLLSPMDVLVEKMFATFECVKIDIEEFFAHSLRVNEYLTMIDVRLKEEETLVTDCSWLDKQTQSEWVKNYITVVEQMNIPISTPDEWVREVIPGKKYKITTYINVPVMGKRRVWLPAWVTFGRGEKESIAPKPKQTARPVPVAPKAKPVVYDVSPNSAAYLSGMNVVDIAEDAQYTYLAGNVEGSSKLFAVGKQDGKISEIYHTTHGNKGDKGDVRRMMADNRGGVLVEFSNHPIMRLSNAVFETTKLHIRAGDKNLMFYYPKLKAVMPNGDVLLIENYLGNQNALVDPSDGTVKAISTEMSFDDRSGMTAVAHNGIIWEPGSGNYTLVSGFGTAPQPALTKLDTGYGSPFKGSVKEIEAAPDGSIVIASGFGLHRSPDGGKTWTHTKSIYDYGSFDRVYPNSKSEVWAATNTTQGYSVVRYDNKLGKILFRASEFDVPKDGGKLKLQTAPRMLFVDSADNLWVVGGTYGAQVVLIFNPGGIMGYSNLAAQKTVEVK